MPNTNKVLQNIVQINPLTGTTWGQFDERLNDIFLDDWLMMAV